MLPAPGNLSVDGLEYDALAFLYFTSIPCGGFGMFRARFRDYGLLDCWIVVCGENLTRESRWGIDLISASKLIEL